MKIVTGVGENSHVTSKEHRRIIEGTTGSGSYILKCGDELAPELTSSNALRIMSGAMCHHGNVSSVDIYDDLELTNGTQGTKRIDLIVNRYTRNDENQIETNEWVVIMGEPSASDPIVPEYTAGNLQDGDLIDECPVFEVEFDGINVVEIRTLLEVAPSIDDLLYQIKALPKIQRGALSGVTVPASSYATYEVVFTEPFAGYPTVVASPRGNYNISCQIKEKSRTGFSINVRSVDGIERKDRDFDWIAIGG